MLDEQHIVVHLLEDVHTLTEVLGLRQPVVIGGVECLALLPVRGPARGRWRVHLAGPSEPGEDNEHGTSWPNSVDWGDPFPNGAIIRAVGLIPAGIRIPPGDEHIVFDRAVAQWRHLLHDWLGVAAEGPTDFPDRDYYGATSWGSPEYDDEEVPYQPHRVGHRYRPRRLSARAWSHALERASSGDQPPLARVLMTSAIRAATTANWRVAIIDAATAVEVALITGMTAQLSGEASSRVTGALIDATRMLGPRLDLANKLGMPVPPKIRADLVERRNAVVHRGDDITGAQAKAAIDVAWKVVREYDSLPTCCNSSTDRRGALGAK